MEGLPSRIERVRALGFEMTCADPGHSKRGGYRYLRRSPSGFASSRAGKRSAEEESGFRPSALRGGDGKYYARGGRATKESFSQRDWRGEHGSEQGRQHDVIVQTPVHEFDDSAFMRDEFASEPPSSQKWKGSKEDGFRKKEKKLKGDKKFDKGGKMSSKGGSLSAIYPGRDREMKEFWDTVAGADSEDDQEGVRTMDDDNFIDDTGVDPVDQSAAVTTKALLGMRHSLRRATELESLLIFCLAKRSLTIRSRGSLVEGAKRSGSQ
ncbi:hypothetical protein Scep_021005 [Stephania cephalantha]|uniref:Uncharacterized protein n=1 Tax=Stephania cephalantha TaxID=152367 RepID=A0AAP0I126_9MAGN